EGYTDRDRNAHRDDAREQRRARAVNHARKHVAADVVGAEDMQDRWRLADRRPALHDWIVRRDERRQYGEDDEDPEHTEAENRTLAPQKPPPGPPRRTFDGHAFGERQSLCGVCHLRASAAD